MTEPGGWRAGGVGELCCSMVPEEGAGAAKARGVTCLGKGNNANSATSTKPMRRQANWIELVQ